MVEPERACGERRRAPILWSVARVAEMTLEPTLRSANMITGVWRQFGVHAFEGTLTLDDMARMETFGNLWHTRNRGKVVEMAVIFPSKARLGGEERARIAKIIRRWEMTRTASATVILASGLVGSMQRSVLTGLMMIAPPPHPIKVFGTTADAATWLAPYIQAVCGVDATAEGIRAAIDVLCASFRATGPAVPPGQRTQTQSRA
jgi:hypothetical protein